MKKISSVGVIGYGFAGQLHAEAVKKVSPASSVFVTDMDNQKLHLAHSNGFRQYANLDSLLAQKPEVVITALPPSENLQIIKKIISLHPHLRGILIEKPLALNANDVKKLAVMLSKAGIMSMIGLTGHGFHPEFQRAKEIVQSGVLGRILECNEHIYQGAPDFPSHYMTREYGGVIFELGIHTIDHLCYLFDIENWKVTDADYGNPHWGSTASDWCRASLLGKQINGNLISSQVSWAFTRYRADLNRTNYSTTIVGTEGKLIIYGFDGLELSVFDETQIKVSTEVFHPKEASGRDRHIPGYQSEVEAFLTSVANRTASPVSLEYGVRVHMLLDAIISQ